MVGNKEWNRRLQRRVYWLSAKHYTTIVQQQTMRIHTDIQQGIISPRKRLVQIQCPSICVRTAIENKDENTYEKE